LIVALGNNGQPQAEIDHPPPRGRNAKGDLGRVRRFDASRRGEPVETSARRRARRVGLALLVASSLLTLMILYGVWATLRGH
jgi:hypothetical protein